MRQLLIVMFTLLRTVSYAQKELHDKPAGWLTKVPFKQLSGGVILLQARFDTLSQPLNFILDTGSGAISLDSTTAVNYNIPHIPSGRTVNGIAGLRDVDYTKNKHLYLPGLTTDSLDFYINNYDILTSVYGEKIDGIIGYSFLSRYIISINFDSSYIEIYSQGSDVYPQEGYLLHPLFTSLPIQSLTVKDARNIIANFYMDTGAGLCLLVSKQFNEDSSLFMKRRKPVPIQVQGLGGKRQMMLTIAKEVQIGPYKFRRVPANILNDEFNATSYPFLGGLVGDDLLRRFNVVLNYAKKEIHLLPNSHYNDEFDYSYTGINMFYTDGKIVSDEVIEKSPAYKAGLRKGDVIIAVNSNFSGDISAYKSLMQNIGQRVTLLVLRDGAPLIIIFRVGHIR